VSLVLALALVVPSSPALADQVLLSETTFLNGSESQTVAIDVPGPGTLDVTLTDLSWPDKLASLSFSLSGGLSLLTPEPGSPTLFQITGAEALYGHISGTAGSLGIPGLPNFGLYSLTVTFSPTQQPQVPLPASLWQLAGGLLSLAGLALLTRRRTRAPLLPTTAS